MQTVCTPKEASNPTNFARKPRNSAENLHFFTIADTIVIVHKHRWMLSGMQTPI